MVYEIDKTDPRLLIIRYNNKIAMNKELCKISERYEGFGIAAEGHNFPASFIEKTDRISCFIDSV